LQLLRTIERFNERREVDFGRNVFISDDRYSPSLPSLELSKLVTIADSTYIAGVGMEEIDRLVLGFFAVVAIKGE
jgi:hypothetical protein